jgi:hypothetical protein
LEDDDESVEMDDANDEFLDKDNNEQFSARRYKDYHVYHSEAKAVATFANGQPACGIIL